MCPFDDLQWEISRVKTQKRPSTDRRIDRRKASDLAQNFPINGKKTFSAYAIAA